MSFLKKSLQLLSAQSQYASIADNVQSGLDLSGDFTIEWCGKVLSQPGTNENMSLVTKWLTTGAQRSYRLIYQDVSGVKRLLIEISQTGGTTVNQVGLEITLETGKFYSIGVSCDISNSASSRYKFIVNQVDMGNGSVIADNSITSIFNSTASFAIGSVNVDSTPIQFMNGLVQYVRIWSDVRTPQEIADNAFRTLSISPGTDNLIDEWRFAGNYNSQSGNNNLTPSGSPIFVPDVAFSTVNGTDWGFKRKLEIDSDLIPGSSDLDFAWRLPVSKIPESIINNLQSGEVFQSWLMDDPLLKAYYRFTSAALTTDSSAEGHTLTAISDPAAVSLRFGNGVAFDGNDAYSAVDHADFKPTTPFAVGGWIRTSNTGSSRQIFASYSQNTAVAGWALGVTSGNLPRFVSGNNTGTVKNTHWTDVVGITNVCDGNPHLVIGIWTGVALQIWVDGKLEGTTTWANAPAYAATNYVRLGCLNTTGTNIEFFNGDLDDAFIVHRALSEEEIVAITRGGADLRITADANGEQELPFEVVRGTTLEELYVRLTAKYNQNTPIYLWSGNNRATPYSKGAIFGQWKAWNLARAVYHMNDMTPASIEDSTANQNTGVKGAANQPLEASLGSGKAQNYSGGSYTVKLTNPTSFRNDNQGGVFLRFKLPASVSAVADIISYGYSAGTNQMIHAGFDGSRNFFFQLRANGSANEVEIVSSFALNVNTEYEVFVTSDGTNLRLYINGVQDTSASITPTGTGADGDWFADITNINQPAIGFLWRNTDSAHYTDLIDEVFVFGTPFSANLISAIRSNFADADFWLEGEEVDSERDFEAGSFAESVDERDFETRGLSESLDERAFEVIAETPEVSERDFETGGIDTDESEREFEIFSPTPSFAERTFEVLGYQATSDRSFETRGRVEPGVITRRDYIFKVLNRGENLVWEIPYTRITLTEELNKGLDGSLSTSFPALKKYANKFGMTVDEVIAAGFRSWRLFRNEDLLYRGVLSHRAIFGGSEGATTATIYFTDYVGFLERRKTAEYVFYSQVDSADIAWQEVDRTQNLSDGDLGIELGQRPDTKKRQRTGRFDNLRDWLVGMSREKVFDGYDFDIDNTLRLNFFYPKKGDDKPEIVFSDFNIISWSDNRPLASKIANKVNVLGAGFEDEMVTAVREQTNVQEQWGLLESNLAEKGIANVQELSDRGDRELERNSQPKDTISITVRDVSPDILTYHLGDSVRVRIADIGFDEMLRIVKRTIQIYPSGEATITIGFEEYIEE